MQFVDHTKCPVHKQLECDPPVPKFYVMFEAVSSTDVPPYPHSEAYLASKGVFAGVGPVAPRSSVAGVPEFIHYLPTVARPRILGGTNRG
jgi:hypothetical protein